MSQLRDQIPRQLSRVGAVVGRVDRRRASQFPGRRHADERALRAVSAVHRTRCGLPHARCRRPRDRRLHEQLHVADARAMRIPRWSTAVSEQMQRGSAYAAPTRSQVALGRDDPFACAVDRTTAVHEFRQRSDADDAALRARVHRSSEDHEDGRRLPRQLRTRRGEPGAAARSMRPARGAELRCRSTRVFPTACWATSSCVRTTSLNWRAR